ncbi:MAG TPA: ROK family protein, partial [Anaerolineales bacterium]|nr:ROK family protein [Anaerolineales bacterium]
ISSARAVMQHLKVDSLDAVHSAFEAGGTKAKESIERAARYLGISLANLIGTLNIQKIVLTGDMTRFGTSWLETVNSSMRNAALTRMSEGTQLELGTLDYRACILGASAFLLLDGYSPLFGGAN